MTTTRSIESDPDTIIQGLHRIREAIVDSFGGDLHKLTAAARERQIRSGKIIWRGKASNKGMHPSGGSGVLAIENHTAATG